MRNPKKISVFFIVFFALYILYTNFFVKEKFSIDEFGINYNEFRSKNNIPLLPVDWILDNKKKYGIDNFHSPNMQKLGHRIKYINLLKSDLGAETDKFYLTQDSIIESRYERKTGNKFLYLHNTSSATFSLITNDKANYLLEKYKIEFRFNKTWTSSSSTKSPDFVADK